MWHLYICVSIFMLYIGEAAAYVGPGLGLGTIGAFFGVIVAVLLAIIGLIWYPFKRLFKKVASKQEKSKKT